MMLPARPANEMQRLLRLRQLGILDTVAEAVLDGFTQLAASITGMPVALISLVDEDRQWFKSAVGLPQGGETPRDLSFCAHAILQEDLLEVEDAAADPRFAGNPFVQGPPHVVHYAGVPLRLPEGEAIGTLCVFSSVPGRLSQEQRNLLAVLAASVTQVLLLREKEQHLSGERSMAEAVLIAELAPVGMFSADAQGAVLHGNQRWQALLGAASLAELQGAAWMRRIHPDDLPTLQAGWSRTVRERTPYEGLFRTAGSAADSPQWIKFRVQPVAHTGTPVAFVGVLTDQTQSVWLQEELQRKNRLLARALDAARLGLWEYNRSGDVYLSGGWTQLLGLGGKDWKLRARATLSFFPQQELPRLAAARRQLLRGASSRLSLEHQMIDASGAVIWVLTEAQVTERDAAGRALQVVGTSRDITQRIAADAELRAALRAADEASKSKSDFLATMSHEIRTPLNGVIGLTQLLREARLPPMESDSVAMIDSCAKTLLSLVDNILDFSKIEAGRLTLDEVPTDLTKIVQELGDVFTVRAGEKGIRFDLQQQASLPQWITADPVRLRQVLLNLLGNALKFTERGSFGLRVLGQEGAPEPRLCFVVSDTGPGIARADQSRLFTRFTQIQGQGSVRQPGTGLGLAISRQLAHLMGGDVKLVSEAGVGSHFTLEIPLRPASAPVVAATAAAASVAYSDARILLAEDNEVNQLVAQRLLAALGFRHVTLVADGQQAVEACSQNSFDLVLMDCQMPRLDGWQATQALRRMGVTIPVVAFTASATLGDRDRCRAAGMDDYLTKPIEKAVLAEKLHRWLAEPVVQASAGARPPVPEVCFDATVIERFFLGDGVVFQEARQLFLQQTRQSFSGLADLDEAAVGRLMHRVRGSAQTLGAVRLARLCAELEAAPAAAGRDRLVSELGDFATASAPLTVDSSRAGELVPGLAQV